MNLFDRIMFFITQNLCRLITILASHTIYRTVYINGKNIPAKGGLVMAPNHSSYFDPPLIGSGTFKRMVRFMARDTLFKNPVFGTVIKWMGAFPVRRGGVDMKSWDIFVKIVKSGGIVMLFPEGTRTEDGEIHEGKPGAGMLMYKARAKVLPAYAHGVFDAWPKGKKFPNLFKKIFVIYGEPMDMTELYDMEESREVYTQITDRVMERIRGLKKDLLAMLAEKK
jgi:1-acyl-sn-glycerol-3-phosphate acyltransferase